MTDSPPPTPETPPSLRPSAERQGKPGAAQAAITRRTPARVAVYTFCRLASAAILKLIFRLRCRGAERTPRTGAVLVVVNHQSHLDAPAVGVSLPRWDLFFLARHGLFKSRVFAWIITSLNAFPINDDRGDAAGVRAAIEVLRQGRALLVFPEGTRSPDGSVMPFKKGIWLLLSRAKCPVLPVAVEGAYDAWPRTRKTPWLWGRRVRVAVGEVVPHAALAAMGPEAALAHLERTIDGMRLELRGELRASTRGRYPPPGPGDAAAGGAPAGSF